MSSNYRSQNRPYDSGFIGNVGLHRNREMPRITNKTICDTDLLTRTSWIDAQTAYKAVKKGKASGNLCTLWIRWKLQHHLENLGNFIQRHQGKVLFVGLLLLSLCCVGLKAARIETNVEKLWVEDGGRLQEELAYSKKFLGEGHGSTNELVIQSGDNVLTPEGLLRHLKALYAATRVTVDVFDRTWSFKDLCIKIDVPSTESHYIESIMSTLLPCLIITPLDCFWEGSKLLGPDHAINVPGYNNNPVKWTNLNPEEMLKGLESLEFNQGYLPIEEIKDLLDRAGVTTGYQKKWCLDPHDPQCPETAPNKQSKQLPDVGALLTGGCLGFATKFMQWEEDLIVGGVTKNKTNHIVRAEAMQSILQLAGQTDFYEYHRDTLHTRHLDWNMEKAQQVLEAWQRKFTMEVENVANKKNRSEDNVYAFSSTSLLDLLKEFSNISHIKVALGYFFMVVYACVSLMNLSRPVHSQCAVGICGVFLVALSVGAGLGICTLIGITFNASTTQIIPFLALGLGVDDMFLLAYSFGEISSQYKVPYMEQTGACLKRTGVSVLLTSVSNAVAFFCAAIVPIPALRSFVLQAAVLMIFNLATILLVFPAVVSIDLARRHNNRYDVFCCFSSHNDGVSSDESSQNHRTTSSRQLQTSLISERIIKSPQVTEVRSPSRSEYRGPSPPPPYSNNFLGGDSSKRQSVVRTNTDGSRPETVLALPKYESRADSPSTVINMPGYRQGFEQTGSSENPTTSCQESPTNDASHITSCKELWSNLTLTNMAEKFYFPLLGKTPVKVFVIIAFSLLLTFGIYGTWKSKNGLDLTDVVPINTNEHSFLRTQSKYFAFYPFFAVTKDINYPDQQQDLYDFHESFQKVENIIKKEDGSLPNFWLKLMRDWLLDIQKTFDRELAEHRLNASGWFSNASDEAILGYKLMVQTGNRDKFYDKERVLTGRLVDKSGIIFPGAFYNYLSAWVANDAIAYFSCQAYFHPQPKDWYHTVDGGQSIFHTAMETDLQVIKSQPLVYAQMPFYLHKMADTEIITDTIIQIRDICQTYVEKGLDAFPSGIPFTFWEQYINLRFYLMVALIAVLGAIFVVLSFVLANPWIALIVVSVLSMVVVELFGIMGLLGINLSAVPAVILIVSVGITMEFTVHICLGYLTTIGSRTYRTIESLRHMFSPVMHGAISTFLGVVMLAFAEFDFIKKYFFGVLSLLILIGVLNGLVLLPVLLSILGPPAEVVPANGANSLAPPTPEPSPRPQKRTKTSSTSKSSSGVPRRPKQRGFAKVLKVPSDISLSTITEEPSQYSSHEFTIHPELTVETSGHSVSVDSGSGVYNSSSYSGSSCDSCSSSPCSTPPPPKRPLTTKVRATATVKVEVHTPIAGNCSADCDNYRNKKRRSRDYTSSRYRDYPSREREKETSFSQLPNYKYC